MGKRIIFSLLTLLLFGVTVWGQFPPAGTDTYSGNTGQMMIELYGISPIENVVLGGAPVTVQRGAPFDPGDGREVIPIEIVALSLTSVAPIAGPMTVSVHTPTPPSQGEIKANAPGPDYPAASFFDVFVDVSVPGHGLNLTNRIPLHITNAGLTSIPWLGQTHASTQQTELFDQAGNPRGMIHFFSWTPTLINCPPGPPFCDSTWTDPCLLICPKSDIVYKVILKDSCGNPICGMTSTWLDFSQCPAEPCPNEEPNWPLVFPDSCDAPTGTHYFTIDASLFQCTVCQAGLFVNGKFCRPINAKFFDTDGDHCVTPNDFHAGAICNDYNCDGIPGDAADFSIFALHAGHCCPNQPCQPGPPFCDSTTSDPCLLVCPKSDIIYRVMLKDSCGNPICGMTSTWLDFSQCPAQPCPNEESAWPLVFPDSCQAATGIHYFTVDASLLTCTECMAVLYVNGVPCKSVSAKFFDVNGDQCVTAADFPFGSGNICNDYNCDGNTNLSDYSIFSMHLGHCCFTCDCRPGDPNGTVVINALDITYLINYLYKHGPAPIPYPLCSGDANCDCHINALDITYLINYLYKHGNSPCSCDQWLINCGPPLRK